MEPRRQIALHRRLLKDKKTFAGDRKQCLANGGMGLPPPERAPAVADVVIVPLHQRGHARGDPGEFGCGIKRRVAIQKPFAQMVAQIGKVSGRWFGGDLRGPVLAQPMALRDFIGVNLIPAMQQQRERRRPVRRAQPRPHRVALRPLALQIVGLLAVARHKGDPQVAAQIAGNRICLAVPAVFGGPVGEQIETCTPDRRPVEPRQNSCAIRAAGCLDRRRAFVAVGDEQRRQP